MFLKLRGYRLIPHAHKDLEDIWLYTLSKWSPEQADNYVSDILTACKGLVKGEKIGLAADNILPGYWKYFACSHTISYRISDEFLDIIRILHQSRDAGTHL